MKDEFRKNLHILGIIIVSITFLALLLYIEKVLLILGNIFSAFFPFVLGLAIAFILNLPLNFFEKKVFKKFNHPKYKVWNKIKRGVCVAISAIIILAVLAVIFSFIIPQFVDAAKNFVTRLPEYMETLNSTLLKLINQFHLPLDTANFSINWDSISEFLLDFLDKNSSSITNITIDALFAIGNGIFDFVLGIAFAIYILFAKETLARLAKRIIYSFLKKEKAEKLLSVTAMSSKVFSGFISGQCIEVLIIGTLCFIGMLIFKMPYPLMISCVIAITAFIPIFGALIGTCVAAFIIFLESPIKALWFIVFIIVLQQIESNVIYPKVMGKSVGLPGIWVLLAVTVGGSLFGVTGMLLGVPCSSVLYCLLETWLHKRLTKRKICTHTFVEKDEEDVQEISTVTIRTTISHTSDESDNNIN